MVEQKEDFTIKELREWIRHDFLDALSYAVNNDDDLYLCQKFQNYFLWRVGRVHWGEVTTETARFFNEHKELINTIVELVNEKVR